MFAEPAVFVVPPHAALMCSLHCGVLQDPVDAPCGCTFCRSCISQVLDKKNECPLHGITIYPDQLKPNDRATVLIDELLIHCKGGVEQRADGEWVPSSSGCQYWVTIGTRKEHEDSCPFVLKATGNNLVDKPVPPPMKTCCYQHMGCLFSGHTDEELNEHIESCGYGRLLQRIEQLQVQLALRDAELIRLNGILSEKDSKASLPNISEILDKMSRGLEKLDEDSTRFFEDAKISLNKTKTTVYQNSMQVIHSIKEAVETARLEFVAKIEELEEAAKYKLRSHFLHNTTASRIEQQETHATVTHTTTTQSCAETQDATAYGFPLDAEACPPIVDAQGVVISSSKDDISCPKDAEPVEKPRAPSPIPAPPNLASDEDDDSYESDEDIREFIKVSKQEYDRDQELRMKEEECIKQAMRLSLLDMERQSQK